VVLQQIEVPSVFARLAPGHRLRLTLATSAPNLKPTAAQLRGLLGGVYAVRRERAHPSFVELPLADPGSLETSPRSWGDCNGQC
jgi:hypothetical protein